VPGFGNNGFIGPDYATMNLRISRKINLGGPFQAGIDRGIDNGFWNAAGQFLQYGRGQEALTI